MGRKPAAQAASSAAAERTYRVIGPHAVCGTPSGATFTATLDPGQEDFLLTVGHIALVAPPGPGDAQTDSADGAEEE